jgi:hypothetical protein
MRYLIRCKTPLKLRRLRKHPDFVANSHACAGQRSWKSKFQVGILASIETYNENPLSDLRNAEISGVQFALENVESGGTKKSFEVIKDGFVLFVFYAEHVFKYEEIQTHCLIQFFQNVGIMFRELSPWVSLCFEPVTL